VVSVHCSGGMRQIDTRSITISNRDEPQPLPRRLSGGPSTLVRSLNTSIN
jgi:hypothetical protein